MKRCPHCETRKPLCDFPDNPHSPDGKAIQCQACRNRAKTWVKNHPAQIQAWEKAYCERKKGIQVLDWCHDENIKQRFYGKIAYCEHGPECIYCCHIWIPGPDKNGYGYFRPVPRKRKDAHRTAWILHNGRDVPAKKFCCHHCDVKTCCNVMHIFIGTPKDNMDDMRRKNRQRWIGRPPKKPPLLHIEDSKNLEFHFLDRLI